MRAIGRAIAALRKQVALLAWLLSLACSESVAETFQCCTCSYSGPSCDSTNCQCVAENGAMTSDECEEHCRASLQCGASAPLASRAADECSEPEDPPPSDDPWADCEWEQVPSGPTPGAPMPAANAVDLSGGVLGFVDFDARSMRKPIDIEVSDAPAGL